MNKVIVNKTVLRKTVTAMMKYATVQELVEIINTLFPEAGAESREYVDEECEKSQQIYLNPEVIHTLTNQIDRYGVLGEM